MGVSRVINRRTAVLGLLLVILATAGFGFAAGNTVAPSGAGDGTGVVSGFNITAVDYVLDAANPGLIAEVKFNLAAVDPTLTAVPEQVQIQLIASTGAWYGCAADGGDTTVPADFTCTVGNVTVVAANQLRVIAAD
jgi:hypothetical protein